jgi:hexosaminidase
MAINDLALVPAPVTLNLTEGTIALVSPIPVFADKDTTELRTLTETINDLTRSFNSGALQLSGSRPGSDDAPGITLRLDRGYSTVDGAYALIVDATGVIITSASPRGIFYGLLTLTQLLSQAGSQNGRYVLPSLEITDIPRFGWRGMHLDISRHFFPVEFIKKYIDLLALHKMNIFHWHLTDDQGWRIEIKKYPLLTEIGAWRTEPDGSRYGGFYTQEEIRSIVDYARERFVTIVPEIELPGHASAALAAYPEFSCSGGPIKVETQWGIFDDVYCAGNDATFSFLQDILTEVAELFPSKYIHIGGDECPKARWHTHDLCQARMKSEGLSTEDDLQAWFVSRIARHLDTLGKRLIGWDEILDGGAPVNAAIMAWRSVDKGVEAARAVHDVVMTPMSHCYFDHYQGKIDEPKAIGGYTPIENVYSFEPTPADLSPDLVSHILGAQGNVWTEYMPTTEHVAYMVVPRICALSEVLWSPREARSLPDFLKRLRLHLSRIEAMGINYRRLTI